MTSIAIIGAGAAGCFTAANMPYTQGVHVVVFEKSGRVMQKVKASGGGRCNVTNGCFDIDQLTGRYPRGKQLMKKLLHRFGPQQTIQWFERRGVMLKTEDDGRVFPVSNDSQTIIDCIWTEMMAQKTEVRYHKQVTAIEKQQGKYYITFADNSDFLADSVVITTGGYQRPDQYSWLQALGHSIAPPVPSLFTFNIPNHAITKLMGVSVADVIVRVAGTRLEQSGPLLITHWGISGPAILKLSSAGARTLAEKKYDFQLIVNWVQLPVLELATQVQRLRRESGAQQVGQKNPWGLPRRLWEHFLDVCGIAYTTRWGDLPAKQQQQLLTTLAADVYNVGGKTTFKEEFVTCGGVTLSEINPATMESRIAPGIYFAGEVLDVDGMTGGYNFQNAWAGAWIAAQNLKASVDAKALLIP